MSGCHCRTIQSFSAGGPVATKTVATAIYARYFRLRSIGQKKQHNRNDAAQTNQPLHAELPVQLSVNLWINKSCGISWINKGQKLDKLMKLWSCSEDNR